MVSEETIFEHCGQTTDGRRADAGSSVYYKLLCDSEPHGSCELKLNTVANLFSGAGRFVSQLFGIPEADFLAGDSHRSAGINPQTVNEQNKHIDIEFICTYQSSSFTVVDSSWY